MGSGSLLSQRNTHTRLAYQLSSILLFFSLLLPMGCVPASRVLLTSDFAGTVSLGGVCYIPLTPYCEKNQIRWEWDPVARVITLETPSTRARFLVDSRIGRVNEERVELKEPIRAYQGSVFFPVSSLSILRSLKIPTMEPATTMGAPSSRFQIKKIVLDPGHGGKDSGARGKLGTREKDVVLDLARRIRQILEQNGIQVIMTRDSDRFISLAKRAQIANRSQSDFFISLHANASKTRSAKGFEVYYFSDPSNDEARAVAAMENAMLKSEDNSASHSPELEITLWDIINNENRTEASELARAITTSAQTQTGVKNRGLKSARFVVLKATTMPAVLVEIGFLSNAAEEKKLRSSEYRHRLARAITKGIFDYKARYEKTEGFTN